MVTKSNHHQIQSVVTKTLDQQFSHSQAKRQPSSRALQPSKVESLENQLSHFNNTERLTFGLEHFGHLTIEEGGRWTQAEIDAEWARQFAAKLVNAPTERSPAFVLNWDFKPEPQPEYHVVSDEEVDDQALLLPFVYKPGPNNQIDWDAIQAQPHVANSSAYKTALVNLKKRKSEENLEVDTEAIKNKYQALKGKVFPFSIFRFFILINLFIIYRFLIQQAAQLAT